jgi:hypothetical protein
LYLLKLAFDREKVNVIDAPEINLSADFKLHIVLPLRHK